MPRTTSPPYLSKPVSLYPIGFDSSPNSRDAGRRLGGGWKCLLALTTHALAPIYPKSKRQKRHDRLSSIGLMQIENVTQHALQRCNGSTQHALRGLKKDNIRATVWCYSEFCIVNCSS